MEAKNTTFNRPSHEEVRQMLLRAKARQQQLEEEGKRMWEEEQMRDVTKTTRIRR